MIRSSDANIHLIFELAKFAVIAGALGTAVGLISYYKSTPPLYSVLATEIIKKPTYIINGDLPIQSTYYGKLPD